MKKNVDYNDFVLNALCSAYQLGRNKSWYKKYGFCSFDSNGTVYNFSKNAWDELIELADLARHELKNENN